MKGSTLSRPGKNSTAWLHELLAKLLDYNIGVLVQEMYEDRSTSGFPEYPYLPVWLQRRVRWEHQR